MSRILSRYEMLVHDRANTSAVHFHDAILWQRGLYPKVTCPDVRVIAEWRVCWPPVAAALAKQQCVVYAFGVADDDAFTNYLAGAGCHVYAFDPGADHPLNWKPNVTFHHVCQSASSRRPVPSRLLMRSMCGECRSGV